MKNIHIECLPDEHLVKKIGFTRKDITHHQGKSKALYVLSKSINQFALVDEDPGSPKTSYEKTLSFIDESEGIKLYSDKSGNKILYLTGKLEDWIIATCKKEKLSVSKFGLPGTPDQLHDTINQKLPNFEKLLSELISRSLRRAEVINNRCV
ncbi:MAG: hypothetical protein GYA51_04965 [Candidatus Methanofastidiosa archaeon]|nr:hypothetical protein [Candidatus Methanofastidiosa archaeon]